jgi:hypothetical protein
VKHRASLFPQRAGLIVSPHNVEIGVFAGMVFFTRRFFIPPTLPAGLYFPGGLRWVANQNTAPNKIGMTIPRIICHLRIFRSQGVFLLLSMYC